MNLKTAILTWSLSLLAAGILAAAWIHTHPTPRFVLVDVNRLVREETAAQATALKAENERTQQEAAIRRAAKFGQRLDQAMSQLAEECRCIVINRAAIVAQPGTPLLQDATARVKTLLTDGSP